MALIEDMRAGRADEGTSEQVERELQQIRTNTFRAVISDLNRAIDKKPDFVEAIFNKGHVHFLLGEHGVALDCYARVLELQPTHANALFCTASIKKDLGQLDEALTYFKRAIKSSPNDPDAWFEMGQVLWKLGRVEHAKKAHERAAALDPSNLQPKNGMTIYVPHLRLFT